MLNLNIQKQLIIMPHAVTHVLLAIIIADIIRDYIVRDNKKFPLHYILIAGIAGLIPDIDVIAYWFLNLSFGTPLEAIHRVYTHTFIIPVIILIAGIAGLLPDIDVIAYWFLHLAFGTPLEAIHRVYTHTFIIPIIILAAGLIIWKSKKLNINLGSRMRLGPIIILIAFGYFIHIVLHFLIIGVVYPFYPLSSISIGLNMVSYSGVGGSLLAGLDAILLVLWLVHEEMRHKISDYI